MTGDFFSTILSDEEQTQRLAARLSRAVHAGDIVALSGDLGAGKSTFARALIRERMSDKNLEVPSPTFTLVQSYEPDDGAPLLHTDLYRLSGPEDVEDLGLDDEMAGSILLVEWPDRMPQDWWHSALRIDLRLAESGNGTGRSVTFSSQDSAWQNRLKGVLA